MCVRQAKGRRHAAYAWRASLTQEPGERRFELYQYDDEDKGGSFFHEVPLEERNSDDDGPPGSTSRHRSLYGADRFIHTLPKSGSLRARITA